MTEIRTALPTWLSTLNHKVERQEPQTSLCIITLEQRILPLTSVDVYLQLGTVSRGLHLQVPVMSS